GRAGAGLRRRRFFPRGNLRFSTRRIVARRSHGHADRPVERLARGFRYPDPLRKGLTMENPRETEQPQARAGTATMPDRPAPPVNGADGETAAVLARLSAGARSWISRNAHYLDPEASGIPVTPKVKASLELALLYRIWKKTRPEDEELKRVA